MKLALPGLAKVKRSSRPGSKDISSADTKHTVQQWLPVQDILGGFLVRADGYLAAVIRVEPAAFSLLSQTERARRITALHEAIQGLPGGVQVVSVPRPIDLDAYITDLEARQLEADGSRKAVLRGYVHYVRSLAANAEAMERRFYLLIAGEGRNRGEREELQQRTGELVQALARAELQVKLCNEQEVLDLLFCFFHPAQAAFERPAIPTAAPVYTTAKEVMDYGLD